jgi:hypothetical protein
MPAVALLAGMGKFIMWNLLKRKKKKKGKKRDNEKTFLQKREASSIVNLMEIRMHD